MSFISDILFGSDRGIENLIPNVVIEESHEDELEITDHPIDSSGLIYGAVTDNAFVRPWGLRLTYGWSPSAPAVGGLLGTILPISSGLVAGAQQLLGGGEDYLTGIYTKLRTLQQSRVPFRIITGKRIYTNMLLQKISFTTNHETEYAMMVSLQCRHVFLAQLITSNVAPATALVQPQQNAETVDSGTNAPAAAAAPNVSIIKQFQGSLQGLLK